MIRWVFLIAWTMHGLGHVSGVLAAFVGEKASGFAVSRPWILPGDVLVSGLVGKGWALIWLAAGALIVASSYGLLTGAEWWRTVALWGAVLSLVAIVPWARTVPPGALLGAVFAAGVAAAIAVPIDTVLGMLER